MTDAEILATARFTLPQAVARDNSVLLLVDIVMRVAEIAGKQLYLTTWANGISILVDADPHNKARWEALIVNSYRAAEEGYRGPVSLEEAI